MYARTPRPGCSATPQIADGAGSVGLAAGELDVSALWGVVPPGKAPITAIRIQPALDSITDSDWEPATDRRPVQLAVQRTPGAPPVTAIIALDMIRGEFVPPTFEPVVDVTRKHPVQLRTSAKAQDTLYLAYSRAPGAPLMQIQFAPVQDLSTLEAGAVGPSSRSSLSPARPPAAPSPDGLLPSVTPPAVVKRRPHDSRRRATTDAGTGAELTGDTAASTLASSMRSESMTELDHPVLGVEAEAWSASGSRYSGWVPMSTTMFGHDARLWVNQAGHAGLGKQRLAMRVWKDHSVLVALLAAAHAQGQDHLREAAAGHRGSAAATEQSGSLPSRTGNAAAVNAPLSATPRDDARRHSLGARRPAPRRSFSEYHLHGRAPEEQPPSAPALQPSAEQGPAPEDTGLDLAAVDAESVLSGSTLSAAQPAARLESPRTGLSSPLLRDSPGSWDCSDPPVRIAAHLPQRWAWLADDPTSEALGPVAARRATVLQAISPALLDSPMKRRFTLMSPIAQSGSPAKSSPQPQRAHGSPPASHAVQAHFVPGLAPPASNMPAAAAAPLHLAWLEELTTELADTPAGEELMADLALLLLALHTRQPAVVRLAAAALQTLPEHAQSKHLLPSAAAHVVGMYLADVLRTAPADTSGALGDCIAALLPAAFGLPCGTVHALLTAHTSLPSFWYQRSDSANSAATYVATQRRREESLHLATAASTAWHQYQRAQSACAEACAGVCAAARARPAEAMLDERSLLAELSAAWHQHNTPSQFAAAAVWRALRAHMPATQQDPNSRACIVLALLARAAAVRACDPAAEVPHSRGPAVFARPRLMAAIARTTAVRCLAAAVGAVERLSPSSMPALAVTARATVIPALLQLAHTSYLAYQPLRTACLRMLPALWDHARDAVAADWPLLAHTYVDGVLAAPGTASTPECATALSDVLATLQGMLSTPTAWLQLYLTTDVAHPLAAAAPHYRTVSRLTTAAAHLIMARGMRSYDGTSRSADTQLPDTADAALGADSAASTAGAAATMFQPALGVAGPTVWDTDAISLPELGVAVQPLVREAREMGIFEPADRGRALLDAQRTAVRVLATAARHIMDLSGTVVMGTGDGTPAPSTSRRSGAGAGGSAPTHASRASTGHRGSVSSAMVHKRTSLPSIAVSSASSDACSEQQLTPPAASAATPPLPSAHSERFPRSRTLAGPVPPAATPSKHRSALSINTSALASPAAGFITRRFGGLRTVLTQREQPASISSERSAVGALVHELVQADAGACKAWKVALAKHSARKALAALLEAGCVPGAERDARSLDSAMLACLVRLHASLWGLEEVGEWLGDEGRGEGDSAEAAESRSALLRQAYFSGLDVAGRPYEDSLRHWLTQGGFKLPGEGQKVGRLVAAFAAVYAAANPPEPGALASVASDAGCLYAAHADAVEILTFSAIMLNTDAHSNAIRAEQRMTVDQFVRNLRGVDLGGQDLPAAFLKQLYTAIVRRGIKQVGPAQMAPAASSQSTAGRFTPMTSDSRRSRVRNRAASTTPLALSTPGGEGSTRASSTSRLSVAGFASAQGMSIGQPEDVHQKLALDPIHVVPVLASMHNCAVLDAAELRVQHAAGCSVPVMQAALAWISSAGVLPDAARERGGQSAAVDAVCRAVAQVPLSALQDVALLRYALQTLAANVLPVLQWLLPAAVFGERLHLLHPADVRRDVGAVNAALDCCKFTLSAAVMCGDAGVAEPLLDLLVHLVSGNAAGSKHAGGRRAFAKPKKEPDWAQTIRAGLLAAAAARDVEREGSALSPAVLHSSPVEQASGTVRALVESMTPQPQRRRHARAQHASQPGGQHRRARTAAADLSVLAAAAEADAALPAGAEPAELSTSPTASTGPAAAIQGYDAADTAVQIGAALSRVHAQVEELRARVANTSNQSALVSMANRFSKQSRTLLMVNRRRRVIHEGALLKYCRSGTGKVKRYFAVLFSDMLVYARTSWFSPSLRVQRAIPLQNAALIDDPEVLTTRGVEPSMLLQNSEKSLYLAGETAMATLSWRRAIAEALRANTEAGE